MFVRFFTLLIIISFFTNIFPQNYENKIVSAEKEAYTRMLALSKVQYPGDSEIDVTYYKLDLNVSYTPHYIDGAVTVNARVDTNSISNMFLDLQNALTVDSVYLNGAPASFTHTGNKVNIDLDRIYNQDEEFSVVVYYQGVPGTSGFGSFEFSSHSGHPIIWTLSEPYGASDWWPNKDTPADKPDSADIWITVDESMTPVSNGSLEEIIDNGDGTHTYKWHEGYPIAAYLISMAITNYHQYDNYFRYSDTDSMVVTHFVYPEDFSGSTQNQLDKTIGMLEIFSDRYELYPYINEKYGHAEFGWGGGMEHQTITSIGGFWEGVMAHELAHQWFGDKVTCKDWHHIWLNEGFATYSEAVYWEALQGEGSYNSFIADKMASAKNAQGTVWVQDISNVNSIFDYNRSYAKGAVILHMLRGITGDSTFFHILRAYLDDPDLAYNSATTEDFQADAESVYGQPLDYFFQEWIYGEHFPHYTATWSKTHLSGDLYRVNLNITQTMNNNPLFFTMPVQIKINTALGDTTVTVFNNSQIQNFEIEVNGQPTSLVFDPNNYIMKQVNVVVGVDDKNVVPFKYSLEQNYPNPFNPSTKIKYQTAKSGMVNLKVYNVLGSEVATLVNKELPAGNHEVEFDASNLPSGIYFYTLNTGKFNQTKKMILLR